MGRLTKERVITALQQNKGVVSHAARALECSRQSIYNYIDRHEEVKEAFDEINEATIDRVEQRMLELIDEGHPTLIIFYLKTKGKHRGYVERQEVTGKDGDPIVLVTGMDTDEL